MKYKRAILIGQIAMASILAYGAASLMAASTTVPNYRVSSLHRALVVPNRSFVLAQGGMLAKRLHKREQAKTKEVEQELEKNPKLVDDPNYLAQHPRLAQYIRNHPEAKQEIERDPKAFFANMEKEEKRLQLLHKFAEHSHS
jgi:hypothetical protein